VQADKAFQLFCLRSRREPQAAKAFCHGLCGKHGKRRSSKSLCSDRQTVRHGKRQRSESQPGDPQFTRPQEAFDLAGLMPNSRQTIDLGPDRQ
jgi:hypothetical protein